LEKYSDITKKLHRRNIRGT